MLKKNTHKLYGYKTTNRAKHNLKVHLIFVCKYRKKLLIGGIEANIKNIIKEIEVSSDFEIIEMETDKDHIYSENFNLFDCQSKKIYYNKENLGVTSKPSEKAFLEGKNLLD